MYSSTEHKQHDFGDRMLELYDGNRLRFWAEEKSYFEDRIGDLKTLRGTVNGPMKKLEDTIHTMDQVCKNIPCYDTDDIYISRKTLSSTSCFSD